MSAWNGLKFEAGSSSLSDWVTLEYSSSLLNSGPSAEVAIEVLLVIRTTGEDGLSFPYHGFLSWLWYLAFDSSFSITLSAAAEPSDSSATASSRKSCCADDFGVAYISPNLLSSGAWSIKLSKLLSYLFCAVEVWLFLSSSSISFKFWIVIDASLTTS